MQATESGRSLLGSLKHSATSRCRHLRRHFGKSMYGGFCWVNRSSLAATILTLMRRMRSISTEFCLRFDLRRIRPSRQIYISSLLSFLSRTGILLLYENSKFLLSKPIASQTLLGPLNRSSASGNGGFMRLTASYEEMTSSLGIA